MDDAFGQRIREYTQILNEAPACRRIAGSLAASAKDEDTQLESEMRDIAQIAENIISVEKDRRKLVCTITLGNMLLRPRDKNFLTELVTYATAFQKRGYTAEKDLPNFLRGLYSEAMNAAGDGVPPPAAVCAQPSPVAVADAAAAAPASMPASKAAPKKRGADSRL